MVEILRNKRIPILVTEIEKNEIEKAAKDANTKTSEFVRQAVFEKIRHIKNPELYNAGIQTFGPEIIAQMMGNQKKTLELQELLLEKTKIFDDMSKTLQLIHKYSSKQELGFERETIVNLFKAHKSLSIKDIVEKTDYDKDIVFQIVSDETKFKLNINTGRFELNDWTKSNSCV